MNSSSMAVRWGCLHGDVVFDEGGFCLLGYFEKPLDSKLLGSFTMVL